VPHGERGARLSEAIPLLRRLWSGEAVTHPGGRYPAFADVAMLPPARQPGGPPIWCGGRADAALARTGRLADGWISYVVTPEQYRAALDKIEAAAAKTGRQASHFGTGHLLFARLDDSYERALDAATETLSRRYAMDFRRAAERYAALGTPEQVAARIRQFHAAGARHIVLDLVGPYEERPQQIEAFARNVIPLLADLQS
jgi:alkanesulfonate monooxygenase SsuD/methylene tetrahydromethanopterin reductase-like flavin-dependent oxidoreductase (luciferase family)